MDTTDKKETNTNNTSTNNSSSNISSSSQNPITNSINETQGENSLSNDNAQIDEKKILKVNKKVKKLPFVLLILLSLIIIGGGVYFFLQSKNKYDSYKIIGADLVYTEQLYQAGKPYYKGRYQYIVNDEKYYYDYNKKFTDNPDKIIQIRYNPKKPTDVYDKNETILCIVIIATGALLLLITIGKIIAVSSIITEKIVEVVVEDIRTCVGGRKIFMKTLTINGLNPSLEQVEYYSYFTDRADMFPIGKKIKFNAYKFSEVLSTEQYKETIAYSVNDFSLNDFIFIK